MKRILYIAMTLVLLVGCKQKDVVTSIYDFEVTVSRIESHKVWLDIIPKDEFLSYHLYCVDKTEWEQIGSEQAWIDYLNTWTIEDLRNQMHQGAFFDALLVKPNTDYYVLITEMSGFSPTQVRRESFTSAKENMNGFTVTANDISMNAEGMITIKPQDQKASYFWDFSLKTEINKDWLGWHSSYFYYDIVYYYQMDFFPDMLSFGNDSDNVFNYYWDSQVLEGDTICLLAVGYDATGETSEAYMPFWIIYGGDKKASTVVEAEKDGGENWYRIMVTSPKRNTAKDALWSPMWSQQSSAFRTNRYIPQHIRSAKR